MASLIFNSFREYVADGTIDLDNDTFKLMLLADTYTPNAAHAVPSDVSSHELANGNGYTTGGATLTNVTWTRTGAACALDADDVEFANASFTARYGVIYSSTASKLCFLIDFLTNKTATNQSFFVRWNASGIMGLS
jgi:hypothetical protein